MSDPDDYPALPGDWPVLNCSVCNRLLSGRFMRSVVVTEGGVVNPKYPPVVAGQLGGRPVCSACLAPKRDPTTARAAIADDTPPSWDDIVRAAEEVGE